MSAGHNFLVGCLTGGSIAFFILTNFYVDGGFFFVLVADVGALVAAAKLFVNKKAGTVTYKESGYSFIGGYLAAAFLTFLLFAVV